MMMMMMMMMMMVFPGNQLEVNVFPGQLPLPPGAFISAKTTLLRARPNPRWRMKAKTSAAKLMEICLSEM